MVAHRPEPGGGVNSAPDDPIRKLGTRFCCDAQHGLPVIVSTYSTGRHGRLPMGRREFLSLLGGATIWPLSVNRG